MKQTSNYQLPQWEMTDRVLMSDFNGMTEKIDEALAEEQSAVDALSASLKKLGNCSVVYGTYYGSGEYGRDNPTTLTFDQQPMTVLLDFPYVLVRGTGTVMGGQSGGVSVSWSGNKVSWWSGLGTYDQCSTTGTHYYVAFLKND